MGSYGKISSLFLKLCGVSVGYTADCLQKDQLFVYVFAALLKQVTSMTSSGISKEGLQALAKSVEAVEAAGSMRNGTSNNSSSTGNNG